jgi:hypothetical protein
VRKSDPRRRSASSFGSAAHRCIKVSVSAFVCSLSAWDSPLIPYMDASFRQTRTLTNINVTFAAVLEIFELDSSQAPTVLGLSEGREGSRDAYIISTPASHSDTLPSDNLHQPRSNAVLASMNPLHFSIADLIALVFGPVEDPDIPEPVNMEYHPCPPGGCVIA